MKLHNYIVILLAATLLVSSGCERRASQSASMEAVRDESRPDQESWQTRFDVAEEGRRRVQMRADHMARYERGDSVYLLMEPVSDTTAVRVVVHLFDEAGDSSATLTADRVRYFEEERRFEARGDVVVVTPEGKHLYSEHLNWNEDQREVTTPGFVRIVSPDETIRGYELVADEDLDTYRLANVTGYVYRDDE